jgi:hypothetical protein
LERKDDMSEPAAKTQPTDSTRASRQNVIGAVIVVCALVVLLLLKVALSGRDDAKGTGEELIEDLAEIVKAA